MIHLSNRLMCVADRIQSCELVVDVGTDHGLLPVWLIQNRKANRVIASDINPLPLRSCVELTRKTATDAFITPLLSDGLKSLGNERPDYIVMAGMGGETIQHILTEYLPLNGETVYILQPQTKADLLRAWLYEHSFRVFEECLVEDHGRLYQILLAKKGKDVPYSEAELYFGHYNLVCREPLFKRHLGRLVKETEIKALYDDDSYKELLKIFHGLVNTSSVNNPFNENEYPDSEVK